MSAPKGVAAGFSISGLLDSNAKTRSKYPVVEIEVSQIADHPSNTTYSMDETGIANLAESIHADGLTDLPLVRKLSDGSWQMISGHRRKAAYALLAETDDAYAKLPCRTVEGIDDAQALVMLHAANYFTRELTITERAAATRALGIEVERIRATEPEKRGIRTEDIKAEIIAEQTGRKVSGRTIKREEDMAQTIERDLSDEWKPLANSGDLSVAAVSALADLSAEEQSQIHGRVELEGLSKRQRTDAIVEAAGAKTQADKLLLQAQKHLSRYLGQLDEAPNEVDLACVTSIKKTVDSIKNRLTKYSKEPSKGA